MDLDEAQRRVAERLAPRRSADVDVRVDIVPAGWLGVHLHSTNPLLWFHAGVNLHRDGRVTRPTSDDGFAPVGRPDELIATATTVDEAVDLVVAEAEGTITHLEKRMTDQLNRNLPASQPPVDPADLREACRLWQGGQDVGSSLVRGAARVLTGIPHYFRAEFITGHEQSARGNLDALRAAIALLCGVNSAERRDADGWYKVAGLPGPGYIGRGIKSKPEDDQIVKELASGSLTMPLWGVSLSREVAESFGTRFLFELVGPFPAVPAWLASGIKDFEQELITGGRYRVLAQTQDGETTHVRLQWIGAAGDRVGSDDVLLGALSAADGIWKSELTRSPDGSETLTVRLPGQGNWAEATRALGSDEVRVQRYYPPDDDPTATDDSVWTLQRQIAASSQRWTVAARVDDVVAAVSAPA